AAPHAKEQPEDAGLALPPPPNLHVRQVDFQNTRIFMPGPAGDVKISLAGSMIDRGDHYQAALDATGDTAEALQFSGKITAKAQKATGALALHAELGEGRLALAAPDMDVKRLAGWVSADLTPGAAWPVVKAQLTAGSVKAYGIPLQGVTLTADIQEAASTVVLQGQVMNDSGEVLAEATLDRKDAARDALAVRIDSKLKNLDAFDTAGLQGEAALLLAIAGDKPREADWLSWERLSGSAAL